MPETFSFMVYFGVGNDHLCQGVWFHPLHEPRLVELGYVQILVTQAVAEGCYILLFNLFRERLLGLISLESEHLQQNSELDPLIYEWYNHDQETSENLALARWFW